MKVRRAEDTAGGCWSRRCTMGRELGTSLGGGAGERGEDREWKVRGGRWIMRQWKREVGGGRDEGEGSNGEIGEAGAGEG
eukprot:758133-Hanusia_phi.AAC.2